MKRNKLNIKLNFILLIHIGSRMKVNENRFKLWTNMNCRIILSLFFLHIALFHAQIIFNRRYFSDRSKNVEIQYWFRKGYALEHYRIGLYTIKRGILRYPASHLSIVNFLLLSRRSFSFSLEIIRYEEKKIWKEYAKYFEKNFKSSSDSFEEILEVLIRCFFKQKNFFKTIFVILFLLLLFFYFNFSLFWLKISGLYLIFAR